VQQVTRVDTTYDYFYCVVLLHTLSSCHRHVAASTYINDQQPMTVIYSVFYRDLFLLSAATRSHLIPKARYTPATKSKGRSKFGRQSRRSWRQCCQIQVVDDLSPKLAIKLTVSATKSTVYGDSRLCCRFVAGFGNSRLSTKSTVLNSTLSPVCISTSQSVVSLYLL